MFPILSLRRGLGDDAPVWLRWLRVVAFLVAFGTQAIIWAAEATIDFSSDPAATWTAARGGYVWDSGNGELDPDFTIASPIILRYTGTLPGSVEHESQCTARVGDSSGTSTGGCGGVRISSSADDGYGVSIDRADTLSIVRRSDSSNTTNPGTCTTQTPVVNDFEFFTVRIAAEGAVGAAVTLTVWYINHGTTKPASDPGWISAGATTFTCTDNSATGTRLDEATHTNTGIVHGAQGSDYDSMTDYFHSRSIADRSAGGSGPCLRSLLGVGC